jgi:hypothetical protein
MDRLVHSHGILPPFILERMAESPDKNTRRWARENLAASAAARATRTTLSTLPKWLPFHPPRERNTA